MKLRLRVLMPLALASIFLGLAAILARAPDPVSEGRHASEWTSDLLSANYSVRNKAEAVLQALGERGVPQLCVLLRRGDRPWEKGLIRLDTWMPFLSSRRPDPNQSRARAAELLGTLGPKADAAIPALVSSLVHAGTAPESERALVRIGSASVLPLERALHHQDPAVRESAARLLREFSFDRDSTVVALVVSARDPVVAVRRESAFSLGAALADSKHQGAEVENAIFSLLALTVDADSQVRAAALKSCAHILRPQGNVIPTLSLALADANVSVRLEAAKTLWKLQREPNEVVPVLTKILATTERWQAAYALGEIGPHAASAIPALAQLLSEERVPRPFRTPPSAAFALGKIGADAVPAILNLLRDPDARVRMNALMAFAFMGKAGQAAVPELMKYLQDESAEVRHTTALTLAGIGAEPTSLIAGLSDCLGAEDIYMRSLAAAALREIAPSGDWVVQTE